jgi:NDP-sugar pyrophosphorylase family protein
MHKDCIILAYHVDISEVSILENILKFLQTEHFCKIVYAIKESQVELEKWLLANYATYGIAVDITKHDEAVQSGEAIWKSLPYCDTEDILVINPNNFEPFDIVKLLSAQILNQADATIVLPKDCSTSLADNNEIIDGKNLPNNLKWSTIVIFKMGFISLSYPNSFDIIEDYCKKSIENKHHIFAYIQA